jgi:peptidyl-tRNA hydrolase, PTH1 family
VLIDNYDLLIFLGNPGSKYQNTYHNAGFWFAEYLSKKFNFQFSVWKNIVEYHEDKKALRPRFFIKPVQFMNLSGQATRVFYDYKKLNISKDKFLIFYDCIDIPMGTTRLKKQLSNKSHNGIYDTRRHFGLSAVDVVQIGILPKELSGRYHGRFDDLGVGKLEDFVLSNSSVHSKSQIINSFDILISQ